MRNLILVMFTGVVGLIGVFGFIQSGIFNVAATNEDGPLLTWLLHTTMEKSVENRAGDIDVPDLDGRELILAGASDYVGMCAQCHGEPGKQPGILTQGLNPAPPDLKTLAEDGTAAEKFWVISNGIRMTGMPAFGKTHGPDEIWPVVAFLKSARELDTAAYNSLIETSKAYGHHAKDSGQEQEHDEQPHDHPVADAMESMAAMQTNNHDDDGHDDDAAGSMDHGSVSHDEDGHHNDSQGDMPHDSHSDEVEPSSSNAGNEISPDSHEDQTSASPHSHSPDAGEHSH